MEAMRAPAASGLSGTFTGRVLSNRPVCLEHYLLRLAVSGFPPSQPGQFINIRCGSADVPSPREAEWRQGSWPRLRQPELLGRQPLLRRPFSLCGRRDVGGAAELEVIYRVVGVGTSLLAGLGEAAELNILGPLGRGFWPVDDRPAAAVVGGGAGIPPLLYLAEGLRSAGKETVAFAGARTGRLLPLTVGQTEPPSQAGRPTMCTAEFSARGVPAVIATDDGSVGATGLIHEAFGGWLNAQADPNRLAVYACGPAAMMKAVADLCLARGVPCQLALERHMACGLGTCQGCVVKVKADTAEGWAFRLACTDGPVFEAGELVW